MGSFTASLGKVGIFEVGHSERNVSANANFALL